MKINSIQTQSNYDTFIHFKFFYPLNVSTKKYGYIYRVEFCVDTRNWTVPRTVEHSGGAEEQRGDVGDHAQG